MTQSTKPIRKIEQGTFKRSPFSAEQIGDNPLKWLPQQMNKDGLIANECIILAHFDHMVLWGKIGGANHSEILWPDKKLLTVVEPFPPTAQTCMMIRAFCADFEYFIWRVNEGKWQASLTQDWLSHDDVAKGKACEYIDEQQVLWGTRIAGHMDGFSRVVDGQEGMAHVVPLSLGEIAPMGREDGPRRLRLGVRHYLVTDTETDWQRIGFSRLYDLAIEKG